MNGTVDERNPAPPWMVETLQIMKYTTYQLVQDFFYPVQGPVYAANSCAQDLAVRQVDLMQPELDLQRKFEATLALTVRV